MSNPIIHQRIPSPDTPVVNLDGSINIIWYRFFVSLLTKSGLNGNGLGSTHTNKIGVQTSGNRVISATLYKGGPNASVAYSDDLGRYLCVYDVQTGEFVGQIAFTRTFP